jgi:hypothetical protein
MKKFLFTLLLLASLPAFAQHHHGGYGHGHGHYRGGGWGWGPIIGGAIAGAVVYDIYNRPVVVQQPPIVIQQQPVQLNQNCTPWTETQNSDGSITRTRTCQQ